MKTLLLALLLTACCHADVIFSTICESNSLAISTASACSIGAVSSASASASLNNTVLSAAEHASASAVSPSLAFAVADLSVVLNTVGPQRSGFIDLVWFASADRGYSGSADSSVVIGPSNYSVDPATHIGACCGGILLPFELGQPFTVEMRSSEFQAPIPMDGSSGGNTFATLTLQFFEADRTTPVGLSEVAAPEPATYALLLLGGLIAVGARRRITY
jgi:PEP-CTERM motif